MQISYHFVLTKIGNLQNLKKKKKKKLFSIPAGIVGTWPVRLVFKSVLNVDVSISVYISVRYILVGTVVNGTVLTTLLMTQLISLFRDYPPHFLFLFLTFY